jgi:hypothetical protein
MPLDNMANSNPDPGEAQPRCGGQHLQDPTINVQVGTLMRYLHSVADSTYIRAVLTKAFGPIKKIRPSTRKIIHLPPATLSLQWLDGLERKEPTRPGQLRVAPEPISFSRSVSELLVQQWVVSKTLEACYHASIGTQVLSAAIHVCLLFACQPLFEVIIC